MATVSEIATTDTIPAKTNRDVNLSSDGKWRSFPKVPNLLQYVKTGAYFGRVKIDGKVFRTSLETDVFSKAKLRLPDFIKKKMKAANRQVAGTFGEARVKFETELAADHTLMDGSKKYRRNCVKALLKTWPGLDESQPDKITDTDCKEWAARFIGEGYDEQFFNNALGTLRMILARAGLGRDDNPAYKIKRLGVKPKELHLPEGKEFDALLEKVDTSGAGQAHRCADFIRFLAFSGCRLEEARLVQWHDVNFDKMEMRVHNSKSAKTNSKPDFRFVPIIPPMKDLLTRLKEKNPAPESPVCPVNECEKSLTRACKLLGLYRITHHDLRHLFATRCIESGVDIPTLSRWLGHVDGGALAMKTYGHLRREHSAAMAEKVKF
jgi:integrase